jgi:maltooligosyltrehalose trehalohydrolase
LTKRINDSEAKAKKKAGELNALWNPAIGAIPLDNGGVFFRVWAPRVKELSLRLISGGASRIVPLNHEDNGYFSATVAGAGEGDLYYYMLDNGTERPDPASRFQPEGVHGPSQVVDQGKFSWSCREWRGRPLAEYIIYELHVGTFTDEGTFEAAIPMLDRLVELGVTAVELMPVAQFPGKRNWGYDGVFPFAPQNSYGGPLGLKRLVDACHNKGLAVILDVVYNHLGPEGNYLHSYGPYFTDRYRTPWGDAINFDGPGSDEVRRFFIGNALYWVRESRIDGLRLDAVHGIFDFSARHFLRDLAAEVEREAEALERDIHVIAESDLNDVRLVNPPGKGGYGLDAQWNDDFHHALHTLLTGEKDGYYMDFGTVSQFARSLRERFVYSGGYSRYRQRSHGNSAAERPARQFVVFAQNHDQVGNRMFGKRLSTLVNFESLKLAAGALLLSPYIPLLFMGEEYGEDAPFLYFIDHGDPELLEAVRKGRKEEFKAFAQRGEPPDPGSIETFLRSKIGEEKRNMADHGILYRFYRELIAMRKKIPSLSVTEKNSLSARALEREGLVLVERWMEESRTICLFNFNDSEITISFPGKRGVLRKLLDSADLIWKGPGSLLPEKAGRGGNGVMAGRSCAVYLVEGTP